jgi:hypothetical protein
MSTRLKLISAEELPDKFKLVQEVPGLQTILEEQGADAPCYYIFTGKYENDSYLSHAILKDPDCKGVSSQEIIAQ